MADEEPIYRGRQKKVVITRVDDDTGDPVDWPIGTLTAELRPTPSSDVLLGTWSVDVTNRLAEDGGEIVLTLTANETGSIGDQYFAAWFDVKLDANETAFGPHKLPIEGRVTE